MTRLGPASPEVQRIDGVLREWQQGDLALEERWFTHIADASVPLTSESEQAEDGPQAITSEVEGLVVVTQTCDIVRSCIERPFAEVAPLVQVSEEVLREVERGRRPRYAVVPAAANRNLVVDLDRVMTVEKSLVSSWRRTSGCATDKEGRDLARALARKRVRFAFPDDFTELVRNLQDRLRDKHGTNNEEGRALRALREIRVRAAPSWDADTVEITFWFIRDGDALDFEGRRWDDHLDLWLELVRASGRFVKTEGLVATLDDLTARDYLESDPLDLDHLSIRER